MPRRLPALLRLLVLLAACTAPVPAADTAPPDSIALRDTLPPPPVHRVREMAEPPAAGVTFTRLLSVAEAERLLRRHGVRPYAVYFGAVRVVQLHHVPVDSARLSLIREARDTILSRTPGWFCYERATRMQLASHPWYLEDDPRRAEQLRRSELSAMLQPLLLDSLLRADAPTVHGVRIVGRPADVLGLRADPLVGELHSAIQDAGGIMDVPGPRQPPETMQGGALPAVAALSAVEVRERLRRLMANGAGRCGEWDRDHLPDARAERPAVDPDGAVRLAGLELRARSTVRLPSGGGEHRGPPELRVTLAVTNPSARKRSTEVRGCTARMVVYRDPAREHPIYGEGRGWQCSEPPSLLVLGPGESREYHMDSPTGLLLGPALAPGRYHPSVIFRLAHREVEIPAGSAELRTGLEGLVFGAESRMVGVAPRELRTRVWATNTNDYPAHFSLDECVRLRAYRSPERTGAPVWRSELRRRAGSGREPTCAINEVDASIAPGDTFFFTFGEFRVHIPTEEILGDSLPPGRYFLTARAPLDWRWTEEFPAGEVELSARRSSLPAERTVGGIRYRVRTRRIWTERDSLRLVLTVANVGKQPREIDASPGYPPGCLAVLHAAKTSAQRDAWYHDQRRDDWSAGECALRLSRTVLRPGESRTLSARVPAPGRGQGRYLYAILLAPDGEGWLERTALAAGTWR